LSDEIYYEQVTHENRTSRLDVSINGPKKTERLSALPLVYLIHKSHIRKVKEAVKRLLGNKELTEIQWSRFILHFVGAYPIGRLPL